jgi:hypothetical protein
MQKRPNDSRYTAVQTAVVGLELLAASAILIVAVAFLISA